MRKLVLMLGALLVALALAACQDDPPPTQIYIVISPTPDAGTATTPGPADGPAGGGITPTASPAASATPGGASTSPTSTPPPTGSPGTPLPPATQQPALFPTNVVAPVQIAEQVFETGRMIWLRHSRQIWVMQASPDDPNAGDWFCYNDTFEEGEPEIDSSLIPPQNMYQPRRGFGKLWRNHAEIRDGLGWAITPEFELTSNYTYIAGGYVENGQFTRGPGEHRLTTLYNDTISFFEGDIRGDCQGGTWRLTPPQ